MNATKVKHTPWLWPDHNIGKRESRQLREEHNATVNSHTGLLAALEDIANRARRIRDNNAVVGVESSYIEQVAQGAITKAQAGAPHLYVPLSGMQVVRDEPADTHRLMRGGKEIASYPNGFSCFELAKRIVAGDKERTRKQAQYIVDCGGTADFALL